MQLEPDALKSKEVLAAFEQLRKLANWMNPNIAAQGWAVNLPAFVKGDMGMVLMGGWAQGNLLRAGATPADFSSGPAPQESGPPCFDLNADCFIFWKPKGADLEAGQKLFAELVMQPSTQEMYSKITGSIPARTDVDLSTEGFTDGQRNSAQNLRDAIAKDRVLLSLGAQHGAAQRHDRGDDRRADRIRPQQRHSGGRRPEAAGRGGGRRAVGSSRCRTALTLRPQPNGRAEGSSVAGVWRGRSVAS